MDSTTTFEAYAYQFMIMIREMIADGPEFIEESYKVLFSERTNEQIVEELMPHFPDSTMKFLNTQDMNLMNTLPVIRKSITDTSGTFNHRQRGVYVCRIIIGDTTFYLYVGMGGSVEGFKKRSDDHYRPSNRATLQLPLFYNLLRENPTFQMSTHALAFWEALPKTHSTPLEDPMYVRISLAESLSMWMLDTSELKLKRPANTQSTKYNGLNVRTGVETLRFLKKLRRDCSEDDRDKAQIAWALLTKKEKYDAAIADYRSHHNGLHPVQVWGAQHPDQLAERNKKRSDWAKNNPEGLAAMIKLAEESTRRNFRITMFEDGRTLSMRAEKHMARNGVTGSGMRCRISIFRKWWTVPQTQIPSHIVVGERYATHVKIIVDGGIPTTSTPVVGTNRSMDFLVNLTDNEYREVYNRAILPAALKFDLMSKAEFQTFTKLNVPALRSVMEQQFLRWILPSPKRAKNRYATKLDLAHVLRVDFFEKKGFENPAVAATNLIGMVAKCVFDDVRDFAPKLRPAYDNYPTVVVVDPSTDKERQVSANDYFKRFKTNWSWFNLAKMVARFTHHQFQAEFMQAFNDPNFQCFSGEDTTIPEDVVHGVVSAYAHGEVIGNPVLHNNEAFFATLVKSFRRTLGLTADKEMAIAERERRHEGCTAEEKDHILRERNKFRLLAEAYEQPGDRGQGSARGHGGNDDNDDDDDENGDGGPGGRGSRTWNLSRLTHSEKKAIERFPIPTRRGQDAQDQDVEMLDETDEEIVDEEMMHETDEEEGDSDISDTESDLHVVCSDTIFQALGWSMGVAGGRSVSLEKAVGSFGGFRKDRGQSYEPA